jgi:hypothetical protein
MSARGLAMGGKMDGTIQDLSEGSAGEAVKARRIGRSIGAVFAGLAAIFILSLGTDVILHGLGVYPGWGKDMSNPMYALATAYRLVYAVLGCYLAARLAPRRPMFHAVILGGIGLVLSTAGAIAMRGMGPMWYPLALIASNFPCTWIGGRLAESRKAGV